MGAADWRRVEDLYHAASELSAAERIAFLDASCGADRALRAEVESLLTYETSGHDFIEVPALDIAAKLMAGDWSSADASRAGTTIANFRVLEKLGEGGMGVVYEAEDTRLGRKVALKFLPPALAANPRARERFAREARAASALNHPHICTIYSVQDDDGQPFIEMERLHGETLRERLARGPLEIAEGVTLAVQLADGLEAAHAKGIIHRDLTPGNVFCTDRGAKILDFGIATLESAADTDRGAVVGTPSYMSPEQMRGDSVDARTDLFSLGAVLNEMVSRPVPATLEKIILKARQQDRNQRYQHASELRADLERMQRQQSRRRKQRLIAAAILFVLLGAPIALWYAPLDLFDSSNLNLREITHNASEYSVGSGAISADGRYAAYADPRGIHILEINAGYTERVPQSERRPEGASWDLSPGWLPDGTGFVVNALGGTPPADAQVFVTGLTGAPRKLRDRARALAVSPDGSSIAFATDLVERRYRDVWIMGRDGANPRKLFDADPGTSINGLAFSPDARRLAYLRADESGTTVAIDTRGLDGGSASTIFRTADPDAIEGLAWLGDGRLLYSVRQPAMGTSAGTLPCTHWQMRLDTTTGRPLAAPTRLAGWLPQCVGPLSFAADGTRVLFLQWAIQDAIHIVEPGAQGDRTSSRRFTFTQGRNIPSGWTPDSQTIVYVSDGVGRATLVRQAVGADTAQTIADEPGIVGAARLTPDGQAVAYLVLPRRRDSTGRLMRVPITGGDSQEIITGKFVDGGTRCTVLPANVCAFAEWSADRRQLVFTSIDFPNSRGRELARVDADSTGDYRWALSTDGARIAVLNARIPRIHILSLAGLPPLDLQIAGATMLGYVSWTSDGTGLLVPSVDAQGAALLTVDLQGHTRVVAQQPGAVDISGIPSPDGRRVAVWVRSRNASLWLAESP